MAHESPGRDFRELPESIRKALQSLSSPLRRSWQADDALSLRFPCFWALCPFELMFSHKTPINVIISEYVKISDFFLETAHKSYLNAILDKVSKNVRKDNE